MTSAPPPAPPVDPPTWPPPPTPPPPPSSPVHTQLRRSPGDRMLGGVCGGIAEYSGIDPLLWRVGFVALTFAGGSGILLYLVLWLLMPASSGEPALRAGRPGRRVRHEPGPRSPVPRMTIAGLFIVIGALALLALVFGWNLGPSAYFASALLVVGLGLVAAAFGGGRRARGGLIALGVVLSIGSIGASSGIPLPANIHGGSVGDRTYRPTTAAQVQPSYRGGVGDMNLDLRGVDVSSLPGPITTRIGHGVGDVTIEVPADADVHLTVHSGLGTVDAFGKGSVDEGFFPATTGTGSWVNDDKAEFDLTIDAGLGDVKVSRG